jgi:hypothetical protein
MNSIRPSVRLRRPLVFVVLFGFLALIAAALGLRHQAPARAAGMATLDYSSYIGDSGVDEVRAVTVDTAGNIYLFGDTGTDNFWGTGHTPSGYSDLFVAKLNPAGSEVIYLTLLGGSDTDTPQSIQVDSQGNVYATVSSYSDDFPTLNALWPERPHFSHDGALFKLDRDGNGVYSTYLPLDVFDGKHNLAVDAAGNAYVTGTDFLDEMGNQIAVLKISPDGSQLLMDAYVGGVDNEKGRAIALDGNGNIYLAGTTESGEAFPVTANAHQPVCGDIFYQANFYCFEDGVVVVLNKDGQVTYSSHHGGSFSDEPVAIAADGQGNVLIAGNTTSGQFPLVNALQNSCPLDSSSEDCRSPRGFVSLLRLDDSAATLTYSTYLGSTESDSVNVVMDAALSSGGRATVIGYTNGRHFPVLDAPQSLLAEGFCTTFGSERYCFDAFALNFSAAGGLTFGTYLGGAFDEFPYDVALSTGAIHLAGMTESLDFPTTANAIQPGNAIGNDGFLSKIAADVAPPPPPPPPLGDYNIYLPMAR